MELMDKILAMPYDEKMNCAALLWCWWTERNKANRGERRFSVPKLKATITSYMQEWKLHLKKDPQQELDRIQSWKPPPTDWNMLNTDGAFGPVTGRGGWGAVGL
jgi:hypothetical protein